MKQAPQKESISDVRQYHQRKLASNHWMFQSGISKAIEFRWGRYLNPVGLQLERTDGTLVPERSTCDRKPCVWRGAGLICDPLMAINICSVPRPWNHHNGLQLVSKWPASWLRAWQGAAASRHCWFEMLERSTKKISPLGRPIKEKSVLANRYTEIFT